MSDTVSSQAEVERRQHFGGLWRHPDFLKLWGAQTISEFGSQVTLLALPLTAALILNASAVQMGLLAAAGQIPFLLFSLLAGVWVDRVNRRPLLIAADVGRALLLLSIPLAAFLGRLYIEQLYAVVFGVGVLTVFFEVAHYAYVPALVQREQLVECNSKLQVTYAVTASAGPGMAGVLIELLSAPFAIVFDAVSFLLSALLLRTITTVESRESQQGRKRSVWREMREGLQALLGHPLLRPIILESVTAGIFMHAILAIYILYATRELGVGPVMLGLIFAVFGMGAVLGALIVGRAAQYFGVGPSIIGGELLAGSAMLLIPLAAGPTAVLALVASQALLGVAGTVANILQWSLRQAVTPDQLQGRVTASQRFIVWGAYPLGALFGGFLATAIGLRAALLVLAIGSVLAPLWMILSPLRSVREQPTLVDE